MNKYPAIFMDETGNIKSDPYFICGFLEVPDVNQFHLKLLRVRDQIRGLALRDRQKRVLELKNIGDMEQLFQFAYRPSSFELKFSKVTPKNLTLYRDLLKILARKTDMSFTAVMVDKADEESLKPSFLDLYKAIIAEYYSRDRSTETIFIPDEFDTKLSWDDVIISDRIIATIPIESHSCLALQCCDVLGGIIGLGLKDRMTYTNSDHDRMPLVETFEDEFDCKISREFSVSSPRQISTRTITMA
ncbi:MAG: DUF3800 domain-containing protein [Clostridiales Family XIII bacterium]|jgi:hypothetical protein|nr:DUF3800 domain-containing protein [Clostridiales Family XIII bacterium]